MADDDEPTCLTREEARIVEAVAAAIDYARKKAARPRWRQWLSALLRRTRR